jgi:hypothetical protein
MLNEIQRVCAQLDRTVFQQDQAMSACATRYDKLAANYLGPHQTHITRIRLRANEQDHDLISSFEDDLRANASRLSGGKAGFRPRVISREDALLAEGMLFADHALVRDTGSDKSKLRPFTLDKLRDGLAEDKFLEMLGLLVGCERGFRREYFVEEELLRFRYALMNLEFLHALFFPRFGKKLSQQACNGILLARLGFPKCGNDETLVGAIRIHGLSPSMLTFHSPQGAIGRRLARPLVRMLRCAPNQRRPKQTVE